MDINCYIHGEAYENKTSTLSQPTTWQKLLVEEAYFINASVKHRHNISMQSKCECIW